MQQAPYLVKGRGLFTIQLFISWVVDDQMWRLFAVVVRVDFATVDPALDDEARDARHAVGNSLDFLSGSHGRLLPLVEFGVSLVRERVRDGLIRRVIASDTVMREMPIHVNHPLVIPLTWTRQRGP